MSLEEPHKRTNKTDLCFVNLYGTQRPDEHDWSVVKPHMMRRAWKKHKDAHENWIKTIHPGVKKKNSSTSTLSDPSSAVSPNGFSKPQSRQGLSSTGEDTTLGSFKDLAAYVISILSDTPQSPIIFSSEELVISPRPAAEVSGGESDPFGAFIIPLTPRVHQLICHGMNSTRGHWAVNNAAVGTPESLLMHKISRSFESCPDFGPRR
jgi:hypothetical protein